MSDPSGIEITPRTITPEQRNRIQIALRPLSDDEKMIALFKLLDWAVDFLPEHQHRVGADYLAGMAVSISLIQRRLCLDNPGEMPT
jgi:hypothetical protein